MRIAQLASSEEKVPPEGYGGTELVVSILTEELVRRGHEVTLFASGDSETAARLVSVTDRALRRGGEPVRRWAAYDLRSILELRDMLGDFDIIHNHMGWQALPWLADFELPSVTTTHNEVKAYNAPLFLKYNWLPYVAISQAFRRLNYPDELNYVATIYNGIDVDAFGPLKKQGDGRYLLFLGRICHDKGTAEAIEIAKRLKLPIILAGKVDVADQDYFEKKIRRQLNATDVRFIGEVNHRQKVDLFKHAIATVYPISFQEPFGLVMAESLASGTPVMAFDRGSVREVLSDPDTAIIGDSVDELVERFQEVRGIHPQACRERVRTLFSKERMVDEYEKLYRRLTGGRIGQFAQSHRQGAAIPPLADSA